ncbi:MAG TPA: two-component system response regulator [candidate division Zixibacteria bacterium]|nr:two-component system response regulator [candidate division Zixibacteria bacterium]HBZ02031.1 two-component system response regulator [candidate division Zixibacteria bacterium]
MNKNTILIVDDEESQREAIAGFLRKLGYKVISSPDGASALEIIQKDTIDLVISDMKMPVMGGLELLQKAKAIIPDIAFILMTAYGSVNGAVESMKLGAFNYLTKPIDLGELEISITKALENRRLLAENKELRELLRSRGEIKGIVCASPQMEEVLNLLARVAPSSATILIQGESGTGKERIARAIHYSSTRAEKPMVIINCAAMPETLLESELFGHEKGAFTGAHINRKGKIEVADGGTLFIDEIGDMPLSLQPKLLRFLQEGTIEKLGSSSNLKLDIRVIAATHRDLRQLVADGKFREDLYYRLDVINIKIPPLRERKQDLIPLAEHFIRIYSEKNSKKVFGLSREAKDALIKYQYRGNVRELENAIEAAVVLTRNEAIGIEDLPLAFRPDGKLGTELSCDESLPSKLEALEKKLVLDALQKAGQNKSQAARDLGISEKNIRDRLKRWGYSV